MSMMDVSADPNQAGSGWLRSDPSAMGGGGLGEDMGGVAGGGGDMWGLHGSMADSNNAYYNRAAMHPSYRASPGKSN
jgi:hypothetical protein